MKKLYFHPDRKKIESIPVFTDTYHHESITYFLCLAEKFEPQLVEDLDSITPLYTKTENLHKKQRGTSLNFMDNWDIFDQATIDNNPHLLDLKNSIIEWARKFHLVDDSLENKTFLEIALWAIPDKRDHPATVEDRIKFFEKIGKPMPEYEYQWSITDTIYWEDESEDEIKGGDAAQPDKLFPFAFTPDFDNLHQFFFTQDESAGHYEGILVNYDLDVSFALRGEKENVKGPIYGYGWDPRINTWGEFEAMLDVAFEKYKKLYKSRTEYYMEKHGYVQGKEKRNKEHFEWLVRYQIQGWSIKDIADYYSKEEKILGEDTIKKALVTTAEIVGLKLRK